VGQGELVTSLRASRELTGAEVSHLLSLHQDHYDGVEPTRFRADLSEKHWVLCLQSPAGDPVVGFSTQKLLVLETVRGPVRFLFSGDTVIRREYWGSQALVAGWCRLAGRLLRQSPGIPLYWFLISKGHRTYRYLPLFFHSFYPRYDQPTPPELQELLDRVAGARYPGEYDPATGLLHPAGPHDRLRPELDTALQRERNRHVAFFLARNPGYREGTELACLAEIARGNMRRAALRELEVGLQDPTPLP